MATTTALHLGLADNGRVLTLAEFLEADEEPGYRFELARGVLEVTAVPREAHGQIAWNLLGLLRDHQVEHPRRIRRCGGGDAFRLWLPGMVSARHPDVAVVLQGTPEEQRGERPPTLVMEVVSAGGEARDYQAKREEYLVFGIREHWIVDPQIQKVTVLIRNGDVWIERIFTGEQTAAGVVLPGFTVALANLWDAPDASVNANGGAD
jgi:Uma2 family endonuclease